jgi:hypothetical protein
MSRFVQLASGVDVVPVNNAARLVRYALWWLMRKTRSDRGVAATHGYSITHPRLHNAYYSMRARCRNPKNPAYANYGGRGITVATEWNTAEAFCAWAIANGYDPELTLERLDNSKGYSPDNCAWVDRKAQARNRRSSRFVEIDGERKTVAQWAEESAINFRTLRERAESGKLDASKFLSRQRIPLTRKIITINGVGKTLLEWASDAGVHYTTICRRIAEGWTLEDAYTRKRDAGWRSGKKGSHA